MIVIKQTNTSGNDFSFVKRDENVSAIILF